MRRREGSGASPSFAGSKDASKLLACVESLLGRWLVQYDGPFCAEENWLDNDGRFRGEETRLDNDVMLREGCLESNEMPDGFVFLRQ